MLKARVFLEGDSLPLVNGSSVVFEASFANSIVAILGDGVTAQDVKIVQMAVFTPIEAVAGTRRRLASKKQSTMLVVDFLVQLHVGDDVTDTCIDNIACRFYSFFALDVTATPLQTLGGRNVLDANVGTSSHEALNQPELEPEPEPEPDLDSAVVDSGMRVVDGLTYPQGISSERIFVASAQDRGKELDTAKTYAVYHRVIGGVIIQQKVAKDVECEDHMGDSVITPHSNRVYSDYCHPSAQTMLSCYDPNFCTLVEERLGTELEDRTDVCSSPDETRASRCNTVLPESGGVSVIGAEFVYLDLNDTVCQVITVCQVNFVRFYENSLFVR